MENKIDEQLTELKEHLKNIEYMNSALNLLYWDMKVGIPKKGIAYRGDVLGYLSDEAYKLKTSDKIKVFIDKFQNVSELDDITGSMIKNLKKEYEKTSKIPQDKFKEYVILQSKSEAKWEEAKEKSDFTIFQPYLEKIVAYKKEFIEYWGYSKNKYDTLLDFYEPDIKVDKLDGVFSRVRETIVKLLEQINSSKVGNNPEILKGYYPIKNQQNLGNESLKAIGFDCGAGRLDESVHPFTIELNNKDVRITTHYDERDMISSLYSCIHEGGHAIYEQNISEILQGTLLATGVSMGIHESQSRLYENLIGRSRSFLKYFYPYIINEYPKFIDINFEDFYKEVNKVIPSLIRTEADELTYSLHIIIRYEIEKMLFNDEIEVKELPAIWNSKYKEYLGVEPKNDSEGVLQDTHWSDGSFGYFPSYALGNLYGAQLLNTMKKEIPLLDEKIEKGELICIKEWLVKNIHRHGSVYTPSELIKRVTGEELNEKYFIEYLTKKYSDIYDL